MDKLASWKLAPQCQCRYCHLPCCTSTSTSGQARGKLLINILRKLLYLNCSNNMWTIFAIIRSMTTPTTFAQPHPKGTGHHQATRGIKKPTREQANVATWCVTTAFTAHHTQPFCGSRCPRLAHAPAHTRTHVLRGSAKVYVCRDLVAHQFEYSPVTSPPPVQRLPPSTRHAPHSHLYTFLMCWQASSALNDIGHALCLCEERAHVCVAAVVMHLQRPCNTLRFTPPPRSCPVLSHGGAGQSHPLIPHRCPHSTDCRFTMGCTSSKNVEPTKSEG
jgi:hypothetical protein